MESIALGKEFQSLLCKLESTNHQALEDRIEEILQSLDKQVIQLFSKIFCSFIPSRTLNFKSYSNFFLTIPSLSNPIVKDIFLATMKNQMRTPNQPELCEFFSYLVENKYVDLDNAIEIILFLLKSPEKLQNLQFLQFLYCVFRIQNILEPHPKYTQITNEFKIRYDNINIGANLDENAPIYTFLYEQLKQPETNPLINIISDSVVTNHPFDVLEPSLFISSSLLSFTPPLSCVCAFCAALNSLKSLGAQIVSDEDDEGRTVADFAAASGNIEVLKYLKSLNVDFSEALRYCIEFFRDDAFDFLVSFTPLKESPSASLLHSAAKVNNIAKLEYLISTKKLSLNYRDDYNWTPLHIAASENNIEALQILLQQPDIDVNAPDLDGETPLHCAAKDGYIESMGLLLQHSNINPDPKDTNGATPLHWAAMNNQSDAVRLLINLPNGKVNVNQKDCFDRTPLLAAALSGSSEAMRILLTSGIQCVDVNIADKMQVTPFIAAVERKSLECVKLLVETNNVDYNKTNSDGLTAFHLAVFNDEFDIVKYLLDVQGVEKADIKCAMSKNQLSAQMTKILEEYFNK